MPTLGSRLCARIPGVHPELAVRAQMNANDDRSLTADYIMMSSYLRPEALVKQHQLWSLGDALECLGWNLPQSTRASLTYKHCKAKFDESKLSAGRTSKGATRPESFSALHAQNLAALPLLQSQLQPFTFSKSASAFSPEIFRPDYYT